MRPSPFKSAANAGFKWQGLSKQSQHKQNDNGSAKINNQKPA